jgi:hypothetical protein
MTSQALNRPVDVPAVLQKLDAAIGSMQMFHLGTGAMEEARAAVAELIEASRDLQDAMDENDSNPFNPGPAARFHAADARHRAALAAVEGKA